MIIKKYSICNINNIWNSYQSLCPIHIFEIFQIIIYFKELIKKLFCTDVHRKIKKKLHYMKAKINQNEDNSNNNCRNDNDENCNYHSYDNSNNNRNSENDFNNREKYTKIKTIFEQ